MESVKGKWMLTAEEVLELLGFQFGPSPKENTVTVLAWVSQYHTSEIA
jgi:hypothetical protein